MADTATPKFAYVATLVPVGCSLRCDYVLSEVKHCKSEIKTLSLHLTQPGWAMAPRARPPLLVAKPCAQPRRGAPPALAVAAGSPLPWLATPSEGGAGLRRWLGRREEHPERRAVSGHGELRAGSHWQQNLPG